MIELGKKYQTRDGRAVEILRNNIKNESFPIVGIIAERDGSETQDRWTAEGWYRRPITGIPDNSDLIPVPTKHEGWMFISPEGRPLDTIYPTLEAAKDWEASTWVCSRGFVRLAYVVWED